MALIKVKRTGEQPPAPEVQSIAQVSNKPQTMMGALTELLNGRTDYLFVQHIHTKARYRVIDYDPSTSNLRFQNEHGAVLDVRLTGTKTADYYTPNWQTSL